MGCHNGAAPFGGICPAHTGKRVCVGGGLGVGNFCATRQGVGPFGSWCWSGVYRRRSTICYMGAQLVKVYADPTLLSGAEGAD